MRITEELTSFLEIELTTPRLDRIHSHLHYAGAPRFARPLHRQKLIGRQIVLTEDPDEHLVWYQTKLFVKPLNGWLLDWKFWTGHICPEPHLFEAACGLLVSYTWLLCRESDFSLAQDLRIVPQGLTWAEWTKFEESFLDHINLDSLHQVNRRYQYGELRLTRLNRIYRWTPSGFSARTFVCGYLPLATWYQELFKNSFGWLLASFAYFAVVLSALQVGLATDMLQSNRYFQKVSCGFSVISLAFVAVVTMTLILTWLILTAFHYTSAKLYHWRVQKRRARACACALEMERGS